MEALLVIFALYCLVAGVTFWLMFYRLLGRRDLRGRDVVDEVDTGHGILAFFVMMFLAFVTLALANPIRFAHVVLKAAFWPVTAWLALQARSEAGSSGSESDPGEGAPRIGPSFYTDVLVREGFPATPHNVFALQERLGILLTVKAKQFMEATGDVDDWHTFVGRAGYPASAAEMPSWPQRVLDALVAWDSDVAPHIQDFPRKYVDILLEGKGTGSGFFGGAPDEPLPTATPDWAMKGLGQPDAVPVPPPSSPPVPAPRPPSAPAPAPVTALSDEPRTAPVLLPSPRTVVPTPSASRKAMVIAPSSPRPGATTGAAAVQVIPHEPRHSRPAPPPVWGAPASGQFPAPPPRTGRHARP